MTTMLDAGYAAISGGRTSGMMMHRLLQWERPDNFYFLFANTGKEREETLEFLDECSQRWSAQIIWVEYFRDETKPLYRMRGSMPAIEQHSIRVVDFKTASRKGEPFEMLVDVKAEFRQKVKDLGPVLPNPAQRFRSADLKARTMRRYMKLVGMNSYTAFVGLRADEPKRVADLKAQSTKKIDYECPLHKDGVVEADVLAFWATQPFNLRLKHDPVLGTYEGNCDNCFLKRLAKLQRRYEEDPHSFEWWAKMEEKTGARWRNDRIKYSEFGRVELPTCDDQDLGVCLCTD